MPAWSAASHLHEGKEMRMLLRQKLLPWNGGAEMAQLDAPIDAEMRSYARSFAAPLVVLAVLGAALVLAA
jgi:hypothetical protein